MSIDIHDLYVKYHQDLYNYIYLLTLDKYDTEDILQNTFVKVIKGIKTFHNKSHIKTWLYAIAHNECINYFHERRSDKIVVMDLDLITITVDEDLGERLLRKEEADNIMHYICEQAEPVKSLLILRLLEEQSFEEIGHILDKSEVWCRVTFFRAKKKLFGGIKNEI